MKFEHNLFDFHGTAGGPLLTTNLAIISRKIVEKTIWDIFRLRFLINLRPLLHKLHRFGFHAFLKRFRFRKLLAGGVVTHLLRDLHGTEVGAAHGGRSGLPALSRH